MELFNSCRAVTAAFMLQCCKTLLCALASALPQPRSLSLIAFYALTPSISHFAQCTTHIPRAHPMLASSGSCAPLFHLSFAFQFSLRADVFDCWLR